MFSEKLDFAASGIVTINEVKDGQVISSRTINNLVVTSARTILRNAIYATNAGNVLSDLQLGDMNMSFGDSVANLAPPVLTDTQLVHAYYATTATLKESLTISSRPAIKLTFSVGPLQGNDINPNINFKLITELGLVSANGTLFSRLVVPIIKARNIGLDISWTIII